jgi:hypothetical protein
MFSGAAISSAIRRSWARQPREPFGGRPIAVCLELAQGPIVSALLEYEFFVIFPVNPSMLAKYRRAFVPSGAKDDPTDAALALELLRRHPEKLAPLRRESDDMRALRRLVEARHDYFPQIVDWFRDKETDVFAAFFGRWPTRPAAATARVRQRVGSPTPAINHGQVGRGFGRQAAVSVRSFLPPPVLRVLLRGLELEDGDQSEQTAWGVGREVPAVPFAAIERRFGIHLDAESFALKEQHRGVVNVRDSESAGIGTSLVVGLTT